MTVLDFLKDWARWAANVRAMGYASNSSHKITISGCLASYSNRYGLCNALSDFVIYTGADAYDMAEAFQNLLAADFPDPRGGAKAYPWGEDANYSDTAAGANCGARFAWVLAKIQQLEAA